MTKRTSLDKFATRTIITGRKAIITFVAWTSAPVIRTTIRKEMRLFVQARDIKTGDLIQRGSMILHAGQVAHFVKSDTFGDGMYYVVIAGESCTCPAGLNHQQCRHQSKVAAAAAAQADKIAWRAAAQAVYMIEQLGYEPREADRLAAEWRDDVLGSAGSIDERLAA